MTGYWTIDVPVSPQIVDADMPVLQAIVMPDGVTINSMEVVLNGRIWRRQTVSIDEKVFGRTEARARWGL